MTRSTDTFNRKVRPQYNHNVMEKGLQIPAGLYRGIVVDTNDPGRRGRIKVQISKFYGNFRPGLDTGPNVDPEEYLGAMWCRQLLPFGGTTALAQGASGVDSQSSYGMHGQGPGIDNEVLVAFSGDTHSGIVIGVLPDPNKIDGIAGAGVTRLTASGEATISTERAKTSTSTRDHPDEHPQAEALRKQGLDSDRIRGQNYSSPTRDPSPRTMGMTTAHGHAITLDDGDLENGASMGIRLRTASGTQILMDDAYGMIYINNREGNAWIEINRFGDIDIYGNSLNIATEGNMNFHSGGNINMQATKDINMQANGETGIRFAAIDGTVDVFARNNFNLQADVNGNIKVEGNLRNTAARIDLNGPEAADANVPELQQYPGNTNITSGIVSRVPEAEPWAGHLDVSRIYSGSASGAGAAGTSDSYYYGAPVDVSGYDSQTGEYTKSADRYNPEAFSDGQYLIIQSDVDMRVDQNLVNITTEVARQFGRPLVIVDGFRESQGGGASNSQHLYGRGFDISGGGMNNQDRLDLIAIASRAGIKGIGLYRSGSLHFDIRPGARAGWGDDFTRRSVPSYAVAVMNKHRSGGFT